jgi:signal transduction histidine kinase/ligand-binding sensor domain-containing protein
MPSVRRLALPCLLVLLVLGGSLRAERLPVRVYTVQDGLAGEAVTEIFRDSRGYVWIATLLDGVSRFDGEKFVNYGVEDGLPHPRVLDLLEARDGTYWFATGGGLARFVPARAPGQPAFVPVALPGVPAGRPVTGLLQEPSGRIWAAAAGKLIAFEQREGRLQAWPETLGAGLDDPPTTDPGNLIRGGDGSLWVGTGKGVARRLPDGRWTLYPLVSPGYPLAGVTAEDRNVAQRLALDSRGNLWIGGVVGLMVFRPEPSDRVESRPMPLADRARTAGTVFTADRLALPQVPGGVSLVPWVPGRPETEVGDLYQGSDGRMWIGRKLGVEIWDGQRLTAWTPAQGLPEEGIRAVCEDARGNVWLGTGTRGALRIARDGFVTYGTADGLTQEQIAAVFEHAGELWVQTQDGHARIDLHRFHHGRFTGIRVNVPRDISYLGWGWNQIVSRDRDGSWWMSTGQGLLRFPPVARMEDLATARPEVLTVRDGLGGDNIFRTFADSRGDVWIGNFGASALARRDRATGRIRTYGPRDGIPYAAGTAFAEDRSGNVWIGFYGQGLARYRNGRFEGFDKSKGAPAGFIYDLHLDRAGRLWIASGEGGVARVDRPEAPRPRFVSFTRKQGLATNAVRALTEDRWGRMYLASTRGIDRLDPATGRIRHFTAADGFPNNFVQAAHRDAQGTLWFGTLQGLARFEPSLDPPASAAAPPVWISGVWVDGFSHPVSELGDAEVGGLEIPPGRHQLQVDYVSPGTAPGEAMRYQYRLEGIHAGWSPPSDRRTVTYARLPAGRLRFQVRSVAPDGTVSSRPASLSFVVQPPVWRRWWFLALVAALLGGAAVAFYRWRVASLLAVERMRTGITRDLHDDLGSSLSRISILSEVARMRVEGEPAAASNLLENIGETSRELMEALSESIWAIDPARDDLHSLITRIRRFSGDLLEARGIAWELHAPAGDVLKLSPEQRRQLYLIVKESLHNVVKHAAASSVSVSVAHSGRRLILEVRDDGVGFDPIRAQGDGDFGGHGLQSLRSRAEALGGKLDLDTAPGKGTRVRAEVPV